MNDFINDEEEEAEDQSYEEKPKPKKLKKKKSANFRVDDEDREIIKENTGIEVVKKNRLKRNAEKLRASEPEVQYQPKAKQDDQEEEKNEVDQISESEKRARKQAAYNAELRRE